MFKELTETLIKEVKKGMMSTSHQIKTISKDIDIIIKNQVEILELKNTIEI